MTPGNTPYGPLTFEQTLRRILLGYPLPFPRNPK